MEKTQTTRKQYVVDQETAAQFLFKVDAEQTSVETQTTKQGNFLYHVKGFVGTITIQKSGRVVAKLNHKDYPHPCQEINFVKRFSSEKKLMELAEELKDMVEALRAKARQARIAARKNTEKKAKEETPAEPKTQNPEKKEHGKNALGHIKNSMADMLDKLFLQGVTEEELQTQGFKPARYRSHFRHLNTAKVALVEVRFEDGKYTAKMIG